MKLAFLEQRFPRVVFGVGDAHWLGGKHRHVLAIGWLTLNVNLKMVVVQSFKTLQ